MVCIVYPSMMKRVACDLTDLDQSSFGTVALIDIKEAITPREMSTTPIPDDITCFSCGLLIKDKYIYKVMEDSYHESCLRCSCCHSSLSSLKKCFARHGNIYCEQDHQVLYGKRCQRCMTLLLSTDIVHRVHFMYYHAHCFSCFSCRNQFNLGDEFHIFDGEVLCRNDYQGLCSFNIGSNTILDEVRSEAHRKTPKRPRTILNAQQRRQFKNAFEKSSKPSRKVREQLANETGLSVRVVQVWFQNQRAKMKKMNKKENDSSTDALKHDIGSEGRSTEDIRSSDDEESVVNLDTDDLESSDTPNYTDPIRKLYNMTSSQIYFPYHS